VKDARRSDSTRPPGVPGFADSFPKGHRMPVAALRRLLRALVVASLLAGSPAWAQDVTVFAAASLTNVLEQIGKAYREAGGTPVKFSFAASSALAKQIESGAEADIFASADEQWMDYLAQRNLIVDGTRSARIGNALVLITPTTQTRKVDIKPGFDLAGMIGDGRLATGDPAHVPVGRYAQQALTKLGVWTAVEPKLARTENVRAALALVERGEAPFGIVYATDAAASGGKVAVAGIFPADTHAPVVYPIAIVAKRDRPEVRRFLDYLNGPDAAKLLRAAGFSVK
jgi:molybdate transport system substrate-binding protein